jgi:regulatory factor X
VLASDILFVSVRPLGVEPHAYDHPFFQVRFLDIFQVTQALNTVLNNHKQVDEMRRAWRDVDFESVRNQAALVCNCRHEDLVQLLEVDFVAILDGLNTSREPAREMMQWADNCCDRLMGGNNAAPGERSTMSSRSVLIRWGYVTSQIMRDFVSIAFIFLVWQLVNFFFLDHS